MNYSSVVPGKGVLAGDLRQHVGLAQDEQVLAVDDNVRAAVLRVEDLVALGHVERDALAVVADLAVSGCEHLAALRLLLRGVGEDDAAGGRLLLLDHLDDQPIAEGLELHERNLRQVLLDSNRLGTLARRVPIRAAEGAFGAARRWTVDGGQGLGPSLCALCTVHRPPRTTHHAPRTAHRAPRTAHRAP